MTKSIIVATIICALGATASAQDLDGDGTEETTEETTETTTDTPSEAPAATSSGETVGGHAGYKWGIEASLNSAADLGPVHGLINLGGSYLDLAVDFNVTHVSPADEDADSDTDWAVDLLVGYRMHRTVAERIHPYIEPFVTFGLADDEAAGDPLHFGVGGAFGVDFALFDQFTLGTAIVGELEYETSDAEDVFTTDVLTAQINATFWW